jgi:PAS domain S-box-containing protein
MMAEAEGTGTRRAGGSPFDIYAVRFVLLAAAYWATGFIGLRWSIVPGAGTALWPAAGVAFAGLMIGGLRLWPAIVVGRLLIAVTVGSPQPIWADLTFAVGTMLGALVPAWLFTRYRLFDPALRRMRDVAWIAFGASAGGATISASFGAAALLAAGTDPSRLFEVWRNWWFGFGVGVIVVAPLILSWWYRRGEGLAARSWLHLALALATVAALAGLVFLWGGSQMLRVWHILPAFVWVAIAFQVRGVTVALAITSVAAVWAAVAGGGPMALPEFGVAQQLLLTQEFMAISAVTMLFLAAAVDERRDLESQARLAAIVSSSPDAMISYAPSGRIRSWNRGAETLFGYSAEEALAADYRLLVPGDAAEGQGAAFERALAGEPVQFEAVRLAKGARPVAVAITASQMLARDGSVLGVAAVMRDISERKRAETYQRLLVNELNHRVKNTLAIVQAIAHQSFSAGRDMEEAKAAFEGRLTALSAAHDVLTRESWESASMLRIVEDALAPYQGATRRFRVDGEDLRLPPKTAVSLALAIHELATNAVKYGALSTDEGCVDVCWRAADSRLRFEWREEGGPPVAAPSRRGFGTRLIERSLAAEFEGEVKIEFAREGVVCTIDAPLPEVVR